MSTLQHRLIRGAGRWLLALGGVGLAVAALAQVAAEPWGQIQGEALAALRTKGDPARGEVLFEICQGCHRAQAVGRTNGIYPRLAGQLDTVLIKEMTDIRAGRRRNLRMLPFIDDHVADPQDLADVAAYLSGLPSPPNNGQGPGTDLAAGERDYLDHCAVCHGPHGEGQADRFYPRLAGQHYRYLLRQMIDIRDGARLNAHPHMVEVVKNSSESTLEALADHLSRLTPPQAASPASAPAPAR